MGFLESVKDHILIGGHSAIAGWGLLVALISNQGLVDSWWIHPGLRPGINPAIFFSVLIAAFLTGNGVYALNAYYDRDVDGINKPGRPIPSGRMTPEHAFTYAVSLMALGLFVSLAFSILTGRYLTVVLWSVFTLLGIAYSMPPLKLKARHIFGNLCFAGFAALTFMIGSVAFGMTIDRTYISLVFLLGILAFTLVTMKDFHDYEGDKAKGDITFPVKVGKVRAAAICAAIMMVFLVLLIYLYEVVANRGGLASLSIFFQYYWFYILLPMSFGVYIVLDHFLGSAVSNAYSATQYYLVIFLVGYRILSGAWGATGRVPSYLEIGTVLSLYVLSAFATIYLAWKKQLILKPKQDGDCQKAWSL